MPASVELDALAEHLGISTNKLKQGLQDAGLELVPLAPSAPPARRFGGLKGKCQVPDDFDAPLPDAVLDAFEK